MKQPWLRYLLLLCAQVLLWNFFNFSQFLMIAYLPALVLCLSLRRSSARDMILAFVFGFFCDFFCGAPLGLSSFALVAVAALRRPVIMLVMGSEVFSRGEDVSPYRQGWNKIAVTTIILTLIFLIIYVCIDSAGTRAFWVDLIKIGASLLLSTPISLYIIELLSHKQESKWK